jgi:hypothetical protein
LGLWNITGANAPQNDKTNIDDAAVERVVSAIDKQHKDLWNAIDSIRGEIQRLYALLKTK